MNANPLKDARIDLAVVSTGWDGISFWVHPRAGIAAGAGASGSDPAVVMTANKWLLVGSDVFYDMNDFRTDDLGATWSIPFRQQGLARRTDADEPDVDVAVSDFQPAWHAATKTLLGTGHTVRYRNDELLPSPRRRETAYATYDPARRTWSEWRALELPDLPGYRNCGAGCTQRYDLDDGIVLLPVYYQSGDSDGRPLLSAAVFRCGFDGRTLTFLEHGSPLSTDVPRGYGEPALTQYQGRFFLTLRNDEAGYVTAGTDGLHFDELVEWTFDDGAPLGNYNTQQKWVTHGDGLYLVYTRRGADNDHVFRHRAPLFIGQVDPERLCVIRSTERVLVPERGARLGNFGVTDVSSRETWVTVSEVMTPRDCSKYGADNAVFVAKIAWPADNSLFRI